MTADPADKNIEVVIIDTVEGLRKLAPEWNALFDASPSAAPPLRWKWVDQWWRLYGDVYGNGGKGLRIVTLRRDSTLIGVLPLYEGSKAIAGFKLRQMTLISAGAAEFEETSADYLDLLYLPGEEKACVAAIGKCLKHSRQLRWEELELPVMSHQSPLAALIEEMRSTWRTVQRSDLTGCHLFDLTGGYEEYLKRLSSENRRQARKMLRDAEAEGLTFTIATTAEQAGQFFDEMVDLHKSRWKSKGKAGSFAPRHAQFHRALVCDGAASGEVSMARLSKGATPIAVIYGQRVGHTFHCFQQGVNTEFTQRVRSPGTAAWLLMMRDMAPRGITMFDHQKGPTPFKQRFSTGMHPLIEIRVKRIAPHALACSLANFSARVVRKLARTVRGKPRAAVHATDNAATLEMAPASVSIESNS